MYYTIAKNQMQEAEAEEANFVKNMHIFGEIFIFSVILLISIPYLLLLARFIQIFNYLKR